MYFFPFIIIIRRRRINQYDLYYFVGSVLIHGRSAVSREVRRVQRANRSSGGKVQNGRSAVQEIIGDVRASRVATRWWPPTQLASVSVFGPGVFDHTDRHDFVPVSKQIYIIIIKNGWFKRSIPDFESLYFLTIVQLKQYLWTTQVGKYHAIRCIQKIRWGIETKLA